jgi:hypothetical protein
LVGDRHEAIGFATLALLACTADLALLTCLRGPAATRV